MGASRFGLGFGRTNYFLFSLPLLFACASFARADGGSSSAKPVTLDLNLRVAFDSYETCVARVTELEARTNTLQYKSDSQTGLVAVGDPETYCRSLFPLPPGAEWNVGDWTPCVNTTCAGGTQTRKVTCKTSQCTSTKPATSQACVAGTPCEWDLTSIFVNDQCSPRGSSDGGKIVDNGLPVGTGAKCMDAGKTNSDGWWAPDVATPPCADGTSYQQHLVHTCNFCASGQWSVSSKTYSSSYGDQTYAGVYTCK